MLPSRCRPHLLVARPAPGVVVRMRGAQMRRGVHPGRPAEGKLRPVALRKLALLAAAVVPAAVAVAAAVRPRARRGTLATRQSLRLCRKLAQALSGLATLC